MKIRDMIGLALVGSLVYLHRKRGGDWTLESFKDSLQQLWHGIEASAEKAKAEAKRQLKDVRSEVESVAREAQQRTGYGTTTQKH